MMEVALYQRQHRHTGGTQAEMTPYRLNGGCRWSGPRATCVLQPNAAETDHVTMKSCPEKVGCDRCITLATISPSFRPVTHFCTHQTHQLVLGLDPFNKDLVEGESLSHRQCREWPQRTINWTQARVPTPTS